MDENEKQAALFQNNEFEKKKLVLDSVGHKFTHIGNSEPLLIQGTHILLPIDFLKQKELFMALFTMDVWNTLDPTEKLYLIKFLPVGENAISDLFSGNSYMFRNQLETLWNGIQEGKFHPDVVMQRNQIEFLKRKLDELENMNKRPKIDD